MAEHAQHISAFQQIVQYMFPFVIFEPKTIDCGHVDFGWVTELTKNISGRQTITNKMIAKHKRGIR